MFVDYNELKQSNTIERVAEMLGLKPSKNRMQCPRNLGDKRELVISIPKQAFFCFGCKVGGSLIDLAAHVNNTSVKEAAAALQKQVGTYQPNGNRGLPADGLAYLQPGHPEVHKLGLDTATAASFGAGFAPRGTMRQMILLPIRDKTGTLLGYCGIPPGTKVKWPTSFKEPS